MSISNLKKSMTHEENNRQILMPEGKCLLNTYQKKQALVHFELLGMWQEETGSRFTRNNFEIFF